MLTQNGEPNDTATVVAALNTQASANNLSIFLKDAFAHLTQQNTVLMVQLAQVHNNMAMQSTLPLKAALERKRLRVISDCPPIGKDLLVQFKTGGEY